MQAASSTAATTFTTAMSFFANLASCAATAEGVRILHGRLRWEPQMDGEDWKKTGAFDVANGWIAVGVAGMMTLRMWWLGSFPKIPLRKTHQ